MGLGVAIIGAGLIGNKRCRVTSRAALTLLCRLRRGLRLAPGALAATLPDVVAASSLEQALDHPEVGLVIVATPHHQLPVIGTEAVRRGHDVLLEKPGAHRLDPLLELEQVADRRRPTRTCRLQPPFPSVVPPRAGDRRIRTLRRRVLDSRALRPRRPRRLREGVARRARDLRRRRADRPGPAPHRPRALSGRRRRPRVRRAAHRLLADGRRGQRVPRAARQAGRVRVAARIVDRVEEHVLVRGRDARRQARGRRARRQLRHRAAHALRDAARDGSATGDDRGSGRRRRVVGARARRRRRAISRVEPSVGAVSTTASRPFASSRRPTADDHHPHPAAHLAGRRRHRPPELLPPGRAAASSSRRPSRSTSTSRSTTTSTTTSCSSTRRSSGSAAPTTSSTRSCASACSKRTLGSTIEISSMADIPPGTGLGSSGAFTVGVLKALHAYQHEIVPNEHIARTACEIEIERLGEPVGKQDQYIAAVGGLTAFEFHADERVEVSPDRRSRRRCAIASRTTCCSSSPGVRRSASEILALEQIRTHARRASSSTTTSTRCGPSATRRWTRSTRGDLAAFGELLTAAVAG